MLQWKKFACLEQKLTKLIIKKSSSIENVLNHLVHLTDSTNRAENINFIHIYARLNGNNYEPIKASGEGISCVDDVSRAIILSLELHELFGLEKGLIKALGWLPFLGYMQDTSGLLTNFIKNKNGDRQYRIPSSYKGGAWWSARAKWAWAKAYKNLKDKKYLDLYKNTQITENYDNDVAGILLLAGLEIPEQENKEYLNSLKDKIVSLNTRGYFLHNFSEKNTHLWGYHQLESIAKYARVFPEEKQLLLEICAETVSNLVVADINQGFYYNFPTKETNGLCVYCVSPFSRGLFELYLATKKSCYSDLCQKCYSWILGNNSYNFKFYDEFSGRCFDGIHDGKLSSDCGTESAIEAGFCRIRSAYLNERISKSVGSDSNVK